jgi:hypothetical protein
MLILKRGLTWMKWYGFWNLLIPAREAAWYQKARTLDVSVSFGQGVPEIVYNFKACNLIGVIVPLVRNGWERDRVLFLVYVILYKQTHPVACTAVCSNLNVNCARSIILSVLYYEHFWLVISKFYL